MMNDEIDWLFEYHAPTADQIFAMKQIRTDAKTLAHSINICCPESGDKSAAIRLLRQCVQIANASIVLER